MTDPFAEARAIATAVLYEGYVLYPYRASARKNRSRWQFGVLVPPGYLAVDPYERASNRTELVLDVGSDAALTVGLGFLQVLRRTGGDVPDWDEAVEQQVVFGIDVGSLRQGPHEHTFTVPGHAAHDGTVTRTAGELHGAVVISAEDLPGPYRAVRLRVDVQNRSDAAAATREQALAHALVAAHLILAAERARFLSMTDPPEWAAPAVGACHNDGMWPVLVGSDAVVLSSPIILGDHPQVAPESPRDLYDATEIDEILTLRTMTLTDAEKAEARATDPRAAALVDAVDALAPDQLGRLHGTLRAAPPASSDEAVVVDGVRVARGSRVVLRPGLRRTDAQDEFLRGRTAVVEAVLVDVDGRVHIGVLPDDDAELADLARWHGRFLYFAPDEVEPVPEAAP